MADTLKLLEKRAQTTRNDISRGSLRIQFCTGGREAFDPDGHLHLRRWDGQQYSDVTDEEAQALLEAWELYGEAE